MNKICIVYKERIFDAVALSVMSLIFAPVFYWALISDAPILLSSVVYTKLISIFLLVFLLLAFMYCIFVIYINAGTYSKLVVEDGVLSYKRLPYHRKQTVVNLSSIEKSKVRNAPKSGIKVLVFSTADGKHRISDVNFREDDFSRICNAIVEESSRCKACQSKQVSWSGDMGHCHNCESLTPKKADRFKWENAYQA